MFVLTIANKAIPVKGILFIFTSSVNQMKKLSNLSLKIQKH